MEYMIGALLALGVCLVATFVGLDRDRAFYPTVMVVIASYYGLFAVIGEANPQAIMWELVGIAAFVLVSIIGFKGTLWWVAGALAAHGLLDWFHARWIANPGVPSWWPAFCLSFDFVAAAYLSWLLVSSRVLARFARVARPHEWQ